MERGGWESEQARECWGILCMNQFIFLERTFVRQKARKVAGTACSSQICYQFQLLKYSMCLKVALDVILTDIAESFVIVDKL